MLLIGALPLSSLLAVPAPSAHAQGGAVCTFAASFRVAPGFSTVPSRGTFTTGGETGTIDCVGAVFGQPVVGAGTFGFEGEYGTGPSGGDTCSDGAGRGTYSLHLPTPFGVVHEVGTFTEAFAGNAGQMTGSGPVMTITCLYQFRPTEGDCVTTPARAETLTGQGAIAG